jgi:ornithine cyclodeaminase
MPVLLFDDDDVRARLDPDAAVRAVREALLAAHSGQLHSPPRVAADLGGGNLVLTAGLIEPAGVFGFRAYDTLVGAEQLVAVWGRG